MAGWGRKEEHNTVRQKLRWTTVHSKNLLECRGRHFVKRMRKDLGNAPLNWPSIQNKVSLDGSIFDHASWQETHICAGAEKANFCQV